LVKNGGGGGVQEEKIDALSAPSWEAEHKIISPKA
jgi:hypothetical protein